MHVTDWRERLALPGQRVHMAGIGGVGMAGLALLVQSRGHHVTGCDYSDGPLLSWLTSQGIACSVGHDPAHISAHQPDVIIRSPAVGLEQHELVAAKAAGIPVVDRGVALPFFLSKYRVAAVAGTHGKTTTSSMLAWMVECAGTPVSFCIGGVCPNLGAVARAHPSGLMVVEADESDGTLQHYAPDIAVITNMDLDHVDYFHDATMQAAVYGRFAAQSNHVVWCHGDGATRTLSRTFASHESFGLDDDASVRATNISLHADGSSFEWHAHGKTAAVALSVPGRHNIMNALAASAAALFWGIPMEAIVTALGSFRLPGRRFETVFEGAGYRVISDYAHHPVEIYALLEQARLLKPKRLIAVFQPHRFSRTAAFKKEFARVLSSLDYLVLAPVYAASEPPVAGGTSDDLYRACREAGIQPLDLASSLSGAWDALRNEAREGDMVLIIGAGDVERIGAMAASHWSARATRKHV